MDLKLTRVMWEGEEVVVEGSWSGDISSVHCDLFEGGEDASRVTDWWDREIYPVMSWSERTFAQTFVEAKGRRIEDPINPEERYRVLCSGAFPGGWSMSADAEVEGTPGP